MRPKIGIAAGDGPLRRVVPDVSPAVQFLDEGDMFCRVPNREREILVAGLDVDPAASGG